MYTTYRELNAMSRDTSQKGSSVDDTARQLEHVTSDCSAPVKTASIMHAHGPESTAAVVGDENTATCAFTTKCYYDYYYYY